MLTATQNNSILFPLNDPLSVHVGVFCGFWVKKRGPEIPNLIFWFAN